jgi:GDP-4-dehydro-6-deoxy-D-mannose reductase
VPDFASQLAKISSGELEPLVKVGNLQAERDFTDVRDIVRAYRLLAESGSPGQPYVICSGTSVSIQHILDTLIKISGIEVEIVKDPDLYRSLETPIIYGNNAKIYRETGWQPSFSLEQSLSDAYIEWRARHK